jgi:hypothetical protein
MFLHFEDVKSGFRLKADKVGNKEFPFPSLLVEVLTNDQGEVTFVDWVFMSSPDEDLRLELSYMENRIEIPGLYTVPELGVENATFKEVLEAVKKYYEDERFIGKPENFPCL